jgi:hypothetical protein
MCGRDGDTDEVLAGLIGTVYSGKAIPTLEIIGMKLIGWRTGPIGAEVLHILFKKAEVVHVNAAGMSCTTEPGVHLPARENLLGIDYPSREICSSSRFDSVELKIEAANVKWIYPVISS